MGNFMGTINKIGMPLAAVVMVLSQSALAGDLERNQADRMHARLTGVKASNAIIDDMENLLTCDVPSVNGYACDPTGKTAAQYAIDRSVNLEGARGFYNVTLKNWVTPWTNEEQTVFAPLNDYTATAIGLIRDGGDFRQILHGNVIYHAPSVTPAYANNSNAHYEALEDDGPIAGDLSNPAILQGTVSNPGITQSSVTGLPPAATAGVMTSRAASMAFFQDGTNRAMFRFTLMNHLCTDLEPLKDTSRTPDRVRRDVSRSPGGDSRLFLNGCVGCHAGMDGMAGAFAYYEWDYNGDVSRGQLRYQSSPTNPGLFDANGVSIKHNNAPNTFEYGYATTDNSWVNYWRNGPNSVLGLRPGDTGIGWGHAGETLDDKGNAVGNGARELGIELSNSAAFAQCQVDKVFEAICLRDPNVFDTDRNARDTFVSNFIGSTYDMREVFTDVAAFCKGS